jgi:hypothetical protein
MSSIAVPVRPGFVPAFALGAGLAGGALTSFGQTFLTGSVPSALFNSASPWVAVALLAGLRLPGRWRIAAVAGALTQAGLVIGYYATSELRGYAADMTSVMIWIAAGVVAGPAFGAAGALLRDARRGVRVTAVGITGSVWLVEGLHYLWMVRTSNHGPGTTAGWVYIAVGVLLPLALGRSPRDRCYALPVTVAGAGAAALAGFLAEQAFLAPA